MPEKSQNQQLDELKAKLLAIIDEYKTVSAEKAKYFSADPSKRWSFKEFKDEGAQVKVDKSALAADEKVYFENYAKIAQGYIDRMQKIYEGNNAYRATMIKQGKKAGPEHKLPIKIKGQMLSDAALKTYIKYGKDIKKVVPVELALAQLQAENAFNTITPRKGAEVSPFNVGVYDNGDAGFLKEVKDAQEGTEMYYDVMAEDYLSNKTADQLGKNFTNEIGQRYASGKDYESLLGQIKGSIQKFSEKSGIAMPSNQSLEDNKADANSQPSKDKPADSSKPAESKPADKPAENKPKDKPADSSQPAPSANVLSASVGKGGKNLEADVKKVQNLLNRHGIKVAESGQADAATIAAIEKFQQIKMGFSDGLISPGKNTWKALLGQSVPKVESSSPEPSKPNGNVQAPAKPAEEAAPAASGGDFSHPNASKVRITYGSGPSAKTRLNARATRLLQSILASCNIMSAELTSTLRTYHDQARITKTQTGYAKAAKWYGAEVANASQRMSIEEFAKWWEAYDKKRGRVSSKHLTGQAMDVVPKGNRAVFAAKVKELVGSKGVQRIIPKGVMQEPVDHVEFSFYCF